MRTSHKIASTPPNQASAASGAVPHTASNRPRADFRIGKSLLMRISRTWRRTKRDAESKLLQAAPCVLSRLAEIVALCRFAFPFSPLLPKEGWHAKRDGVGELEALCREKYLYRVRDSKTQRELSLEAVVCARQLRG